MDILCERMLSFEDNYDRTSKGTAQSSIHNKRLGACYVTLTYPLELATMKCIIIDQIQHQYCLLLPVYACSL
jgi:hypothetical protein